MNKLRIAAVADIHYGKHSRGSMQDAFTQISREADVLLLCGDLTDYGLAEEAEQLVADLHAALRIPALAVRGNHDFESGEADLISKVLDQAGVIMLEGAAHEINGVGFAGVCGFGGGFGRRMLNAWGEPLVKQFVQEAIDHAVRLEQALAKLQTQKKIVVLHYAPIRATVQGEDPEVFPFLGSSRLEEPINRFRVTAVFHGHAHNGTSEGATSTGVPVYNVSLPVLKKKRRALAAFSHSGDLMPRPFAQLRVTTSVSAIMRTGNKLTMIVTGVAAATLAGSFAQTTDTTQRRHPRVREVNRRFENQQDRIAQGVKSGELNSQETARLESREARLKQQERTDRAEHGGHLTKQEQTSLNRRENNLSQAIHTQKNDAQTETTTPTSEVGRRVENQQDRIGQGIRSGSLTTVEAARLESRESELRHQLQTDRNANGGALTDSERAQANQELNEISGKIHQQKHDDQTQGQH